jgi:outer membrane immunogenic protein
MKWGAVIGGVALAALASLPATLSASSPAQAADMTPIARPAPAPSYIPAQFFWTGFYLGTGIGGGFARASFVDPFAGLVTGSPSPKGLLVTGIGGINYQIGAVVIGVEGDFTGAWLRGGAVVDSVPNNLDVSVLWTSTITGRFGVAFDRLLVYGKGGAAFDYDRDTVTQPSSAAAVGSFYRAGWTVGGGVEYAFTDHWIGRIAYDYLRFPVKAASFQGNTVPVFSSATVGLNISEIKAIISYKF